MFNFDYYFNPETVDREQLVYLLATYWPKCSSDSTMRIVIKLTHDIAQLRNFTPITKEEILQIVREINNVNIENRCVC